MPRDGDARARLRKKLHDKSVALQVEARRVAEQRDALRQSHVRDTIARIVELKVLRAQGEALLSDLDGVVEQVKVDADNAKTEDERAGASLALEKLAERRERLLKSDREWAKAIDELGVFLKELRGG